MHVYGDKKSNISQAAEVQNLPQMDFCKHQSWPRWWFPTRGAGLGQLQSRGVFGHKLCWQKVGWEILIPGIKEYFGGAGEGSSGRSGSEVWTNLHVDLKLLLLMRNKTNSLQDSEKKPIDAKRKVHIMAVINRIHGPLSSHPLQREFSGLFSFRHLWFSLHQQFTTFVQMHFMGPAVNASSNADDGRCT